MSHPPILTFSPRRGRVTPRQRSALQRLWPAYGVDVCPGLLDPIVLFGRSAPLVVDVGFGMGETTAAMAAADPDRDVLAVDIHTPGVGALLAEIEAQGLHNVRVARGDARSMLRDMLAPGSLDEVRVFFPDPWPKIRHRKRRLVGGEFASLVGTRLRSGGRLYVATDSASYAQQVLAVVAAEPRLANPYAGLAPRPPRRPVTRVERAVVAAGHGVYDVVAVRV